MDPHEAINLVEVVLRDLIRSEMGRSWVSQFDQDAVRRLEDKRDEETKRRSGSIVSNDVLDYTEFTQIQRIILKNHLKFEPAIGAKKHVEDTFRRLNGLRNPTMHSRALLPFERDILSGLAGEILNQVALFRSSKGPDMMYYPTVEVVTDSFGRTRTGGTHNAEHPSIRVYPGDTVEFQCRGADPQGRVLTWELKPNNDLTYGSTATGTEVTLTWTPSVDHVQEYFVVWIWLTSDGRYHRYGAFDEQCAFVYSINPPRN